MMMMAGRSGDDGGVMVANSCKQLYQPKEWMNGLLLKVKKLSKRMNEWFIASSEKVKSAPKMDPAWGHTPCHCWNSFCFQSPNL